MNLQQTVSKMMGREVSLKEAKDLANDQFGMLASFLRKQYPPKVTVEVLGGVAEVTKNTGADIKIIDHDNKEDE